MELIEENVLLKQPAVLQKSTGKFVRPVNVQITMVSRLREGDRSAAEELVDKFYHRIFVYLRELGHSRSISEDLTQDVFLKAWLHIGRLKDDRAVSVWLYRIAGNVSKEHWRKYGCSRRAKSQKISLQASMDCGSESDKAGHNEQFHRLMDAIDAALAAGIKEGTFKSRLNRALHVLRRQFG